MKGFSEFKARLAEDVASSQAARVSVQKQATNNNTKKVEKAPTKLHKTVSIIKKVAHGVKRNAGKAAIAGAAGVTAGIAASRSPAGTFASKIISGSN